MKPERSQLLTQKTLDLAARELAARDEELALVHTTYGDPPLWQREPGFSTLVRIILEQQVSLRSAEAMFDRLKADIGPFLPDRFMQLGETHLRRLGVTCQKAAYLLHLSSSITDGNLSV